MENVQKVYLPFGAGLPIWVLAYLMQAVDSLREELSPQGFEIVRMSADAEDWRRDLPDVGPGDKIEDLEFNGGSKLVGLVLGIDDGTGAFHMRFDPRTKARLPPQLLPDLDVPFERLSSRLSSEDHRLAELCKTAKVARKPMSGYRRVSGALAHIVEALEWRRHTGDITDAAQAEVIYALLETAHHMAYAGTLQSLDDLTIGRLHDAQRQMVRRGMAAWAEGVQKQLERTYIHAQQEVGQADADLARANTTVPTSGPVTARVETTIICGKSRTRSFLTRGLRVPEDDLPAPATKSVRRIVIQDHGDRRFRIGARGINLKPVLQALREMIGERRQDLSPTDKSRLASVGRPEISGERTPIFANHNISVIGNWSVGNPHLPQVDINVGEIESELAKMCTL